MESSRNHLDKPDHQFSDAIPINKHGDVFKGAGKKKRLMLADLCARLINSTIMDFWLHGRNIGKTLKKVKFLNPVSIADFLMENSHGKTQIRPMDAYRAAKPVRQDQRYGMQRFSPDLQQSDGCGRRRGHAGVSGGPDISATRFTMKEYFYVQQPGLNSPSRDPSAFRC